MDLTSRDVAFLIWLAVLAVLVLTRRGGRSAIASILGSLRGKVALILVAFGLYISATVAIAWLLGFWNVGLVKDTIAWFILPGLVLLFGFSKAYESTGYYGPTLVRAVGLAALIEFYVNLGSFPLWVELLLLPVLVLLGATSAVPGIKPETQIAKHLVDRLASVIGLLIIVGTGAYL